MTYDLSPVKQSDPQIFERQAIHAVFEAIAEQKPSTIALACDDQQLTYAEVNAKSTKIAEFLIDKKIAAEELIGVFCTRSFDMIIAVLGILKAGGAYVPLDPDYPIDRLSFMAEDTNLKLILTNISDKHHCFPNAELIDIRLIPNTSNALSAQPRVTRSQLAYAIFTSGSSGKPKASLLEHKSLVNISHEQIHRFELTGNSRVLQFASLSFDAATWEWVMALCSGASLYLLTHDEIHSPQKLDAYVRRHQITHATLPPAILPSLQPACWNSVRHLIVAGEACDLKTAQLWSQGRNFYNAYGPSEVTICATIATFVNGVDLLHLGSPVANTCLYILDDNLNPADQGELYIGGIGLSRGYLNRPELTLEKFIKNPDNNAAFDNLYRSGDLVKVDDEGHLIFVGRVDNQVKIRGNRIELEEIEAVLLRHSGISQAAVLAKNLIGSNKTLLAWVVPNAQDHLDTLTLERDILVYLKEQLPSFMQVARIIFLDKMPLTPNQKIDKKALSFSEPSSSATAHRADFHNKTAYTAPTTPTEKRLCSIWEKTLGVSGISATDNFFWLGGDSLSAAKIISVINTEFNNAELNFSQFMQTENIINLAKTLDAGISRISSLRDIQVLKSNKFDKVSSIQKYTLLMQNMTTGVPYCNNPVFFQVKGTPDVKALQYAVETEIKRHEILRSFYVEKHDEWHQRIESNALFSLEYIDIYEGRHKEDSLTALIEDRKNYSFDLTAEIPMKVFLIKTGEDQHLLGFILHQIAFDGISTGLFMGNISASYNLVTSDKRANSDATQLPASWQYSDYTCWQGLVKTHPEYVNGLQWWRNHLDGAPELHSVPIDFPRPTQQQYKGKTLEFSIAEKQYQQMQQFARSRHVSLFTLLQSAFFLLISHYSDQVDIVTGTVSAGRLKKEFHECMGNFTNVLVLRERIIDAQPFAEFLENVKRNIAQAFAKDWIFFDDLVEYINPKRSHAHNPLVQIMLVFQEDNQQRLELNGLNTESVFRCPGVAKFDLALHVCPSKNEMQLRWEYNTTLFKKSTIAKLHTYLLNVLHQVINHPDVAIADIDLIPRHELKSARAITANNSSPRLQHVYDAFRGRASYSPDKIAIYAQEGTISFRGLSNRADVIAQHLLALTQAVEGQALIAVCVHKSVDLIASMLAIFKIGHVYLPIDPKHPQERIDYMIKDAQASILITSTEFTDRFKAHSTSNVDRVNLDEIAIENTGITEDTFATKARYHPSLDDAAYVIYTSGSTGKPKGVLVSHRNLSHSLAANCDRFLFCSEDVIPAIGSQAFGVSILEFLMPLVTGGAIKMMAPDAVKDLEMLIAETQEVTILHAVPSLMKNWLHAVMQHRNIYPRLRLLLIGGEAVPFELLRELRQWNSRVQILATYGMTEATVICAAYEFLPEHRTAFYIGRAYPNSYFRVLNRFGRQQPVGVPGELCIGGPCIAKGYLHKPELTRSKFFKDPYINEEILYRTGDRVCMTEDGNLEFLGRLDNQINLRGIRIEFGEIESLLQASKEIQQAIVDVKNLRNGEDTLVAYLQMKPGMQKPIAEIREYLHRSLPDYMCPELFVILEQVPLNANGKIDRAALPLPSIDTLGTSPATVTECLVASIWQDILSLSDVPTDKTFFELGGNSLLMTKVINRIRAEEDIQLSLADLFSAQTVGALALVIDNIRCKQLISNLTDKTSEEKKFYREIII